MLESFCSISEGASFGFDKMPKFQIPNAQNAKIPIFFTNLEPPTVTRPHDPINLSLYAKYSLNLLLSRYVSIFGIIFDILVDIRTVAQERQKIIFLLWGAIKGDICFIMTSSCQQQIRLDVSFPTVYNVAYLSSKLWEICYPE